MRTLVTTMLTATCLFSTLPALSHHSFPAEFDINSPVSLTGTVTKIEWTNPHAWFFMDVVNAEGKVESWALELLGVNMLLRQGWTRDKIKPGDVLQVEGYRARNGTTTGNASVVIIKETGEQIWGSDPTQY